MRNLLRFYLTSTRVGLPQEVYLQYPLPVLFFVLGMLSEPIIYLVVWTTMASAHGPVGGYTANQFTAYFIIWTLVRNMNLGFPAYGWEWQVRTGHLSFRLLRPLPPLHYDLAYLVGWKLVVILIWLPVAAILVLIFRPTMQPTILEVIVFSIALWGAYFCRSIWQWVLGLSSFCTVRAGAAFQLYSAVELILSGRLAPLSLMPAWAQDLAKLFPFMWTFGFPIEALIGQLSPVEQLHGLFTQLVWILLGLACVRILWPLAVRRYSAVSG